MALMFVISEILTGYLLDQILNSLKIYYKELKRVPFKFTTPCAVCAYRCADKSPEGQKPRAYHRYPDDG